MNLKQLLGLCEHNWEITARTPVYEVNEWGEKIGNMPKRYEHVLTCKKCGILKIVKQ